MSPSPGYSAGDSARAANELCRQCGFCCDGTLFASVTVVEEEVVEIGIRVKKRNDGKLIFHQPCPEFSWGACSIYDTRPAKCQSYQCKLQKKVMNASLSLDEGRVVISAVKLQAEALSLWGRQETKEGVVNLSLRGFLDWYQ